MPHIVIEYAAPLREQLDVNTLVHAAHQGAIATGLFNPKAVKSRAYACEDFVLGESDASTGSFIHIRVSIMPGRTDEQKQQLTQSIGQGLSAFVGAVGCVSIEVAELHQPSYFKQEH
ncbi:5-carboxymethyl-2-hydroxymuconate Delta-isomerase [Shewanella yunxiaonensis]|uniref:5-carboxymethyl-2-hydroxymuconate Delta-isomerase n=1 Tax=Shewanella yunxiaonensis TaxID=2829809 RepID=A0ABX7YPC7_9GAMM|nr:MULTISPECIES: 5-carboxymethyl-2-hydroxymuconate Delta-isomerase [Shewanella]MDF0533712.1 5-carboxymethyl-2-hydroxymuconate Delta-isomerase [Shewanella sp. A32]QUN04590.1 5-carboxymethyl-2-hydroxymuconate Delta-isomerase [Shewanella yunxiaonensis]